MADTSIEWCDKVWNPVTGCTKVSQGCKNCYAERIANRFWGERKFTDVICHDDRLDIPSHWKKPARVFVNSMSDLFHKDVPYEFIRQVWFRMLGAPNLTSPHTFIILTKRPERMLDLVPVLERNVGTGHNIWLGVSVENQKAADERIPLLLQTPAAVRFVSVEPMLEKIYLGLTSLWAERLDWVICGCESGPGARPFNPDWARSLRDQCQAAWVPFFLKQMPVGGKLAKMPELDGRVWAEFPNNINSTIYAQQQTPLGFA